MQTKLAAVTIFGMLVGIGCAIGAQSSKPQVSVAFVPSEPILASGDCKTSTGGYLSKNGRTALTTGEIGKFVSENLRHGYVLTIYPPTKNGIFVSADCTNAMSPNER